MRHWRVFLTAAGTVLVAWLCLGYFASTRDDPGKFGDMFGAVNALFSGLAFAGIIVTIWIQSQELALQREELAQTREELKGQKEQLEAQANALARQNFERAYFDVLTSFRQLATQVSHRTYGSGIGFWGAFADQACGGGHPSRKGDFDKEIATFEAHMRSAADAIFPYFATLTELLRLVERSSYSNDPLYFRLLRGRLTHNELRVIFYFGLSPDGVHQLKPLIEKSSLFVALPMGQDQPGQSFGHYYAATAYVDSKV